MTRAESFVKSLQDDLEQLQKRLHSVATGGVRKLDCNPVEVSRAVLQLASIQKHLPFIIVPSED
jgi:hypothetical protein